jgi:hypothetical protein
VLTPGSPPAHATPALVAHAQGGLTLGPDGGEFAADFWSLGGSRTITFCVELTSHSPPPTPLLPALTPSAGEHQVSGDEFKVSRTRGGPASHSTRSSLEAQNGRPHFLAAFLRLLSCRHGGATGVLFRVPRSPAAACQIKSVSIGTAGCACWACRARSLRQPSTYRTISAGLPPLCQGKRPPQRSWTLAPKRMATSGGRTGKKIVVETLISTETRLRKIKMQYWITI